MCAAGNLPTRMAADDRTPDAGAPAWSAVDRTALGAVALQFAVNGALFASFIPRLPEIREHVSIGTGQLGVLLSMSSAAGLVGSATVSRLIARFGTRLTIVASASAISLFLSILGVATVWPMVLLGLAGMAMFDVYVDVAMNMQGSWLSARRRRPVMNRLHGLWSLGAAIGGLVASWAAEVGVSLRLHLIVAAAVLLGLVMLLSPRLLPVDEHRADEQPAAVGPSESPGEVEGHGRSLNRVEFFAAGFFAVVVEVAAIGWAAFRLTDDFGETAGFAAIAYVAVTVGMTAGRFAGDSIAHRVGGGRLLRASTVLAAAGLAAAGLGASEGVVIAGFTATGLGAATMIPKLYDDAAQMPGRAGSGLGALTAGIRSAALVVPAIVGLLADSTFSVGTAIAIATLPAAVGFLVVTRHVRPR
jgi:fucose permease